MSYLQINLPAAEGAVLLSEDNLKKWIYVSSKNTDPNKTNLVGRWVLTRSIPDPNLPDGGGGSGSNVKFELGNVIVPETKTVINDDGPVDKVRHDIDFNLAQPLTD